MSGVDAVHVFPHVRDGRGADVVALVEEHLLGESDSGQRRRGEQTHE